MDTLLQAFEQLSCNDQKLDKTHKTIMIQFIQFINHYQKNHHGQDPIVTFVPPNQLQTMDDCIAYAEKIMNSIN